MPDNQLIKTEKKCNKCQLVKPISEYYVFKKDGFAHICKICWSEKARNWRTSETGKIKYKQDKEKRKIQRRSLNNPVNPLIVEKKCRVCKLTLPVSNFTRQKTYKDGLRHECRKCLAEYNRKRHDSKSNREKTLKQRYKLTLADFDKMVSQQKGVCAICGKSPDIRGLYVDHCHQTKKVRGLLCSPCNSGLGHFKDNVDYLNKAVEYLKNG